MLIRAAQRVVTQPAYGLPLVTMQLPPARECARAAAVRADLEADPGRAVAAADRGRVATVAADPDRECGVAEWVAVAALRYSVATEASPRVDDHRSSSNTPLFTWSSVRARDRAPRCAVIVIPSRHQGKRLDAPRLVASSLASARDIFADSVRRRLGAITDALPFSAHS